MALELSGTAKKNVTTGAILSAIVLAIITPTGRWILTPWFASVATEALSSDMSKLAETQAAPANGGVKSMLAASIKKLEGDIRLEEFRKRKDIDWAEVDEMKLGQLYDQLSDARVALAEFEQKAVQAKAALK